MNWSRHDIADNCRDEAKQQSLTHSLTVREGPFNFKVEGQWDFLFSVAKLYRKNQIDLT